MRNVIIHVFVHIIMSLKERKKENSTLKLFPVEMLAKWLFRYVLEHNSMTYKINDLLWITNNKNQTVVKDYIHYSLK